VFQTNRLIQIVSNSSQCAQHQGYGEKQNLAGPVGMVFEPFLKGYILELALGNRFELCFY
jgi:hypothetical protein